MLVYGETEIEFRGGGNTIILEVVDTVSFEPAIRMTETSKVTMSGTGLPVVKKDQSILKFTSRLSPAYLDLMRLINSGTVCGWTITFKRYQTCGEGGSEENFVTMNNAKLEGKPNEELSDGTVTGIEFRADYRDTINDALTPV